MTDDVFAAASFQLCRWSWERKGVTRDDVEQWLRAAAAGELGEMVAASEDRYRNLCSEIALRSDPKPTRDDVRQVDTTPRR